LVYMCWRSLFVHIGRPCAIILSLSLSIFRSLGSTLLAAASFTGNIFRCTALFLNRCLALALQFPLSQDCDRVSIEFETILFRFDFQSCITQLKIEESLPSAEYPRGTEGFFTSSSGAREKWIHQRTQRLPSTRSVSGFSSCERGCLFSFSLCCTNACSDICTRMGEQSPD